ncbi:hypothetical protein ACFL59_12530 [Planctomycetota bacterium]
MDKGQQKNPSGLPWKALLAVVVAAIVTLLVLQRPLTVSYYRSQLLDESALGTSRISDAANRLKELGDPSVLPALLTVLDRYNQQKRTTGSYPGGSYPIGVVAAIGGLGAAEAAEPLQEALSLIGAPREDRNPWLLTYVNEIFAALVRLAPESAATAFPVAVAHFELPEVTSGNIDHMAIYNHKVQLLTRAGELERKALLGDALAALLQREWLTLLTCQLRLTEPADPTSNRGALCDIVVGRMRGSALPQADWSLVQGSVRLLADGKVRAELPHQPLYGTASNSSESGAVQDIHAPFRCSDKQTCPHAALIAIGAERASIECTVQLRLDPDRPAITHTIRSPEVTVGHDWSEGLRSSTR